MADDRPMWGNNRAVAPTPRAAIVAVDLGDNSTVKGHHLSMIKDRQFDGRTRADPHKHIAEFVKICGMFRYGNTNVDAIKLKLFPSSLSGDAKVWFNELSPGVITTWEEMRQAFFFNLKTKVEQGQKNHQAAIQDLETKFGQLSDQCSTRPTGSLPSITQTNPKPNSTNDKSYRPSPTQNKHVNVVFTRSGKTYDPPVNLNAKTTTIHDDNEDEVDEAEKEVDPSSSKQAKSNPPPLKACKPKIPYPQRLRKEKIEERFVKFIDLIKEVKINVPLVDVLIGMP
ncbi:hypothetical protein Tco_1482833 [Tanacetum coccineum]